MPLWCPLAITTTKKTHQLWKDKFYTTQILSTCIGRKNLKFCKLSSDTLHHLFSKFSTLSDTTFRKTKLSAAFPWQQLLSHDLAILVVTLQEHWLAKVKQEFLKNQHKQYKAAQKTTGWKYCLKKQYLFLNHWRNGSAKYNNSKLHHYSYSEKHQGYHSQTKLEKIMTKYWVLEC